jgi:hypothetical protein
MLLLPCRDYGFIAPCVPAGVCTQENRNAYSGFTKDHHTPEASLRISQRTPLTNITNTLASGKTLFYTILVSCFYPMLLISCHQEIIYSMCSYRGMYPGNWKCMFQPQQGSSHTMQRVSYARPRQLRNKKRVF